MGCWPSKSVALRHGQDDNDDEKVRMVDAATLQATTTPPMASPQPADDDDNNKTAPTECVICYDKQDPEEAAMNQPCRSCDDSYCDDCLQKMFTRACFDLSEMPPRCCGPLNLAVGLPVLDCQQVDLFKTRHEEARTVAPVYCPVPTCSAFIPYRLFPRDKRPVKNRRNIGTNVQEKADNDNDNDNNTSAADEHASTDNPPPQASLPSEEQTHVDSPIIPCPHCSAQICCDCKLLSHSGSACTSTHLDLDDDIAQVLKKFKIRQCPKCRTGVRRMYGCPEIFCRCGCHWCWLCGMTLEVCEYGDCAYRDMDYDGSSAEEDDDDDEEEEEEEERQGEQEENNANNGDNDDGNGPLGEASDIRGTQTDLDAGGHRVWGDAQEFDFGGEAEHEIYDMANCSHNWRFETDENKRDNSISERNYLCEQCWRTVVPQQVPYSEAAVLMDTGQVSQADDEDLDAAVQEEPSSTSPEADTVTGYFWCTYCYLLLCVDCHPNVDYASG